MTTAAWILFVLGLCLSAYAVGKALGRRTAESPAIPAAESADEIAFAKLFPAHSLRRPEVYPGESAAEYAERAGVPLATVLSMFFRGQTIDPSHVWSDVASTWVSPPASPLAPGALVPPEDGESAIAYARRRETRGVFLPRGRVPDEWVWSTSASTFYPPPSPPSQDPLDPCP